MGIDRVEGHPLQEKQDTPDKNIYEAHQNFSWYKNNAYNVVLTAMCGPLPSVKPPTKVCDFICDL